MPTPSTHYVIAQPTAPAAIVRVDPPPVQELLLWFHPDQYLRQLGTGGWREVAHPRRQATIEYTGRRLHQVTLDLYFDAQRGSRTADVERDLSLLESWGKPVNPADPLSEPPLLQIRYGHGQQLRWVINDIVPRDEQRERPDGPRVAAQWSVDLWEHRAGDVAFTPLEQAAAAGQVADSSGVYVRPDDGGTRTYTVRPGDTLSGIAARELGSAARWREIATLNNLADPDLITVGQVLVLPES